MDAGWTHHLERHIDRLRRMGLIPPVNAVETGERGERPVLVLIVPNPVTDELRRDVAAALGGVPHEVVTAPFAEDGRRPGVDYR